MSAQNSAQSINRKIHNANQKVGNVLGWYFNVYRPLNYTAPVSTANWVSKLKTSFTLDDKYTKAQSFKFDTYKVYANTDDIEAGDIFVDEDDSTYVIMTNEVLQNCRAFKSNRTVTVTRADYSTASGTFEKVETPVVTSVPANVQYGTSSDLNPIPASTTSGSSIPTYEIYVWAPDGTINLNDIVLDSQGNRSSVLSAHWSPRGYTLKCTQLKAAE